MTRGELVAELLGVWEESAQKMEKEGSTHAAGEVRTAISVLEQTYTAQEMGIGPDPDYEEKSD
jgi:hypothetical protein